MKLFKNTLVVIPARGGSKRIPDKNIKEIYGKPMICWPLTEIKKIFDPALILVSTDSDKIKEKVEREGLTVPFKRPADLADDFTGTAEVVTHALNWFEKNVHEVDFVVTVYPTAVMLSSKDLIAAKHILDSDKNCDCVMSSANFSYPIQRAVFENKNGFAEMFQPENYHKRSQDFIEAKHDAGMFYVNRAQAVRECRILTNSNVKLYPLKRHFVIDIDTVEDFEEAIEKLKIYKK